MALTDDQLYKLIDNVNSYHRLVSESKGELLLNKYPNAAAAYSLRLLDGYYRGPLVRVRDEDGREVDVYADYNNELSLDSLVSTVSDADETTTTPDIDGDGDPTFNLGLQSLGEFVHDDAYDSVNPAVTATVCVWYDQSSTNGVANENDAKQAVATSQPKIYDSSDGLVLENGKAAIQPMSLNGMPTGITGISDITVFTAGNNAFNGTQNFPRIISSYAGTGALASDAFVLRYNSSTATYQFSTTGGTAEVSGSQPQNFITTIQKDGSAIKIALNGGAYQSTTTTSSITAEIYLLEDAGGTQMEACRGINEIIIYDSDQSDNRQGIEQDINNHYQIEGYTPPQPLLDEYSGAAAAYSLRNLTSNSNSSTKLARVRRSTDNTEVDVYADDKGAFSLLSPIVDGGDEISTGVTGGSTTKTKLYEFVYGQACDLTVVVWYDQANGNDATQTTTSAQPKVYDSVTGVELDNTKAALTMSGSQFLRTNASLTTEDVTLFTVYSADASKATQEIAGIGERASSKMRANIVLTDKHTTSIYNNNLLYNTNAGTQVLHTSVYDYPSTIEGAINGGTFNTKAVTMLQPSSPIIYVGESSTVSTVTTMLGKVQEVIIYDTDQNAAGNRTVIERNINDYYNIY